MNPAFTVSKMEDVLLSRVRPFLRLSTLNGHWVPCGLLWLLLLPYSFSQNDRLHPHENATLHCYTGSYDNLLMTRSRACNATTHNADSGVTLATTHCLVFKYNNSAGVSTMFSCDDYHLCDHVQGTAPLYNVTYAGHVGQLFCCEKDNCNDHKLAGPVPQAITTCYHGTKYNGTVQGGTPVTECTLQDGWCVRNITNITTPNGLSVTTEIYSCQPMDLCDYYNITDTHTLCTNTNTSEICCCPDNRCFATPGVEGDESSSTYDTVTSTAESNAVDSPHKVQLIRPDMTSLGPKLGGSHQTWFFVGCLILVFSVFFCLLGTVIMVTVRYRQGRQKQTVTLAYTRIAADSPAGNGDEDIQMLLG